MSKAHEGNDLGIIIELNLGHVSIWHDIMKAITNENILLLVSLYLYQSMRALGAKAARRPVWR